MSALEDWYSGPLQAEASFIIEEEEDAFNEALQAKIDDLVKEYTPQQVDALSPMQLMSQMNETLSKDSDFFGQVLCIRGIYKQGNGTVYNGYYYDNLKDENNSTQVKILVPALIRSRMKADSLVVICGMVTKRIDAAKSSVELQFRVDSIVEEVKAQAIDKDDLKRIELRQRKVTAGFKNVDNILETILLNSERPQIALLLAQNSIALGDFEDGKRAASVAMDFIEERVSFTQTNILCAKLRELDQKGYNAIALVRGGGIDSKTDVDKPEVIEKVVEMNTPFISGVGHQQESIFLRQVADKWTPTPQGLGQYFSDVVEKVTAKRDNSRAALEADIKKQFKDQLDTEKKRNEDLNQQITKLTEANKTTNDALKSQLKTEQLLVNQLQEKLNDARGNKFWVYVIVAVIALIAGFVIARLMFPSYY